MGHALDAPFVPVATKIRHLIGPKGAFIYLGGGKDKMAASKGQLEGYKKIVNFLLQKLRIPDWIFVVESQSTEARLDQTESQLLNSPYIMSKN